jgi:probable rRNA maturation factor
VLVLDEQTTSPLPVDTARWRALAAAVLADEAAGPDAELSVTFVDEAPMADLNEQFMGHAGATDVLAFPIDHAPAEPGGPWLLGDVVICPRVAERNAGDHAGSFDDEVALLVVHGVLHLMGMDHGDADERRAMQARERELLAAHHGPLSGDPWSAS